MEKNVIFLISHFLTLKNCFEEKLFAACNLNAMHMLCVYPNNGFSCVFRLPIMASHLHQECHPTHILMTDSQVITASSATFQYVLLLPSVCHVLSLKQQNKPGSIMHKCSHIKAQVIKNLFVDTHSNKLCIVHKHL